MNNLRLQQLAQMYAAISGSSQEKALKDILSTRTGRAIMEGNPSVLYEQQTHNLYSITRELSPDIQKKFTQDVILKAFDQICCNKKLRKFTFSAAPNKKRYLKMQLKQAHKRELQTMNVSYKFELRSNRGE